MAGLLDPILAALFNDPSGSIGGNAITGLLGLKSGNPGALTSTPVTPSAGSPFAPRTGLLGDSVFAGGLRGALAGLAGSTGYTGLSALGAGAQSAEEAARHRQAFQMQNILGGQQYQQGQQSLIGGNIGNIFSLEKVNAMIDDMNQGVPPAQQRPHVTMVDLMANPSIVNSIAGAQDGQAQGGQPQAGQAPGSPVGMQPIYGGGTGGDPQVAQAYGPSLNPPAQTPQPTEQAAQPQGDPNTQWYQGEMAKIRNLQWAAPEVYKEKLDEIKSDPRYAALTAAATAGQSVATAGATKTATDTVEFNSPQYHNTQAQNLSTAFLAAPGVKDYRNAQPYIAPLIAAAKGDTGIGEIDLINSALHIWNPDAGTIKPGTALSMEDLKGIPAAIKKDIIATVAGGGVLPDVEKNALIQAAINHYGSIAKNYDTTRQNFALRAKGAVPGGLQEPEYNDQASQGGAPQPGMYSKGHIYMGGDPAQPGSWMAVQ